MAKKGESRLQKRIHAAIAREFVWFGFKVHGNEFQRAGIPDLVGCCAGLFFGLEVKMPKGRVSAVQYEVMREIRKAGGYAKVVEDAQTAITFMRRTLEKEGRLLEGLKTASKKRRGVHRRKTSVRALFQAAPRKDVHRRRRNRAA